MENTPLISTAFCELTTSTGFSKCCSSIHCGSRHQLPRRQPVRSSFRFNDSDHLKDPDLYSDKSDREGEQDHEESDPEGLEKSEESDSDTSERQEDSYIDLDPNEHLRETPYMEQSHEELGEVESITFPPSITPQWWKISTFLSNSGNTERLWSRPMCESVRRRSAKVLTHVFYPNVDSSLIKLPRKLQLNFQFDDETLLQASRHDVCRCRFWRLLWSPFVSFWRLARLLRLRRYQKKTNLWSGLCWSRSDRAWICPKWCCPPSSSSPGPFWTNCRITTIMQISCLSKSHYMTVLDEKRFSELFFKLSHFSESYCFMDMDSACHHLILFFQFDYN